MIRIAKSLTTAATFVALLALGAIAAAQQEHASNPSDLQQVSKVLRKSDSATPTAAAEFVIGAEDLIAINVWKEPDLSRELAVRSDGKITLPLVGDVVASGKTTQQLQDELVKRLQAYIESPTVTVSVREIRSQAFNVLGQVARPGSYLLGKPTTVLDAIAIAGGFREWAKEKSVYVLRRASDGSSQRISFNYKKAIQGTPGIDFNLQARDTIVVP